MAGISALAAGSLRGIDVKRVHVAAAVIRGEDGRILIAKRPDDKHQGGLWAVSYTHLTLPTNREV